MITYLPATHQAHDEATRVNFEYIESHGIFIKPTGPVAITGSRGGNVALANLLTELVARGLIINSTTP